MTPLVYRPQARADIDEAYSWYESQEIGVGERFLAAIGVHLERIRTLPETYPAGRRGIRAAQVPRFPYVVYYQIRSDCVLVLAVQHGRRRPGDWRHRL